MLNDSKQTEQADGKVTGEEKQEDILEESAGTSAEDAAEATAGQPAGETADAATSASETDEAKSDEASEAETYKQLAEEYQNRMLRTLADMENLRKRVRKEQEEMAKYASLKVVEALLPALDNFERALAADKETLTVDSLLQGVSMVYRQIMQVVEQEGLAPIEAAGKPFDPNVHQAVSMVNDPAFASGVVVEELQKGYRFKDRVIRPSMVKVNE